MDGGYAFKSNEYQNQGVPLLRISNIENHKVCFDKNTVFVKENFIKEIPNFMVNKDDILVALSGATTGKFGIYSIKTPALLNQRVGRIKPYNPSLASFKFIFYYMDIIRGCILKKAYGAAQPNISIRELGEFNIPIPSLPEQHRIVTKIEELFTRLDAGLDALTKAKAQIKRYRQAVLKCAFEGRLTEEWRKANKDKIEPVSVLLERIKEERKKLLGKKYKEPEPVDTDELPELPKGWEWVRLGNVVSMLGDGIHGTPIYNDSGEYYFINGNNLSNGRIKFKKNTKTVSVHEYHKYKKELNSHTVLVSINGTIGNVAFYNGEKVILGKSACYFNLFEQIDKRYIKNLINSKCFLDYALSSATGSTIKNVPLKAMREFPFPLPPLPEQNRIVEEIERRLSIAEATEKTIDHSLKQSKRLRQSILKRAFEGKLVPQDPSDEPAEKLLERIKEERAKRDEEKNLKRKRIKGNR